jgi:hypothetical protein
LTGCCRYIIPEIMYGVTYLVLIRTSTTVQRTPSKGNRIHRSGDLHEIGKLPGFVGTSTNRRSAQAVRSFRLFGNCSLRRAKRCVDTVFSVHPTFARRCGGLKFTSSVQVLDTHGTCPQSKQLQEFPSCETMLVEEFVEESRQRDMGQMRPRCRKV